ncbi:MAG: LysR family transcriptional regulator [Longibaculum muris]|uniref:DNA-binding transcriptional LysR family regulator n=1 Tax=Longibaculum muris TaxID=1796628 RepID=A0A4R3ZBV9_9FIRM|nr:LysR family transcriptional regulator [Longibaculum muris]KXU39633.1 LysR substrate binding domain protein [Candidatus Stoquefichus sp. KLE1796]MBS5370471.1 LysR family transcriptional regulator [Coprobacillus cateniformis]MCR1886916.1 LysR family transcriptional regulator [Longibaculum muris]MED9811074.1 LysR family transcriptional regulator [Longibaculum muris]TCW02946.1 DNA-binding transcriptional LysR family regulator [Longibaculum muris]
MNIKLEQYKIFNEAASTLSFSLAARNLFISQSAVSQAIHTLEKELNTQLFIRQSKGVVLTKEGEMLYTKISQALSLITSAENQIGHLHDLTKGELTIGAGDTLSENYIMPYLVKFNQLYPQVTIKMVNRTSLEIIDLLKNGQIEIGFVNMPLHDEAITIQECLQVHDIFVSKNSEEKVYSLQELSHESLILLERSSNSRQYVDYHFASQGLLLTSSIELGSHDLLLEAAKNNLGKACVIKEFSLEELNNQDIYEIKINPPIPKRSIGYAHLTRKTLTPAALKFIELFHI